MIRQQQLLQLQWLQEPGPSGIARLGDVELLSDPPVLPATHARFFEVCSHIDTLGFSWAVRVAAILTVGLKGGREVVVVLRGRRASRAAGNRVQPANAASG
eukprot:CAMPEP_0171899640 /NCGR_PEP_ID=MMETSP0992-20121227/49353_1 /TAXON_ID=483369 /ORGANISM="non described non described, Strain CCMP2098" /LENGTH=100 /DNA_ID=CAMNT_0012528001 /DNA_START=128 /DNA_END=431 /DNA_ORIENTATION=+